MISLYVHIPFCVSKCPYCDFTSYDDKVFFIDDYIEALSAELAYYKTNYNPSYETLFIGGGTPTCFSAKQLDYLFSRIYSYVQKSSLKEITIEANPETLTEKKAKVLEANVNRVSIGAQSFDDSMLKKLGRIHTADKISEAAGILRAQGIENMNIDLMFGMPGQDKGMVLNDAKKAMSLKPEHISFYMLTLYEKTEFAEKYGQAGLPGEKEAEEMYIETVQLLMDNGYIHYEISNFAKPGKECRHNLNYWNMKEYIGAGVSAASYFDGKRYKNTEIVQDYIKVLKNNNDPAVESEDYTKELMLKDYIMLALRKKTGINAEDFREKFGFDFKEKYSNIISKYTDKGLINEGKKSISLTLKGMLVSNTIISDFF